MKETIISAKHLVKTFVSGGKPQTIINHLNLEVYQGDFTIIMGSSGAGKSTLMYLLSGMDQPTSGEIMLNGENINRLSSDQLAIFRRKNCGFVFQQIYLLEKMSLMDNVLTAGLLLDTPKPELIEKAKSLFHKVHLPETTYQKNINQVSGGEAQRAGIVRAAINDPAMIFADEPTGALNSDNSNAVLDVLTELNRNHQSIIMVTHDKKSALRGDRIIYLKDGKIAGELSLGKYRANDSARSDQLDQFLKKMGW